MVATLPAPIEDLAEGALETIDHRCQLLGIDKVEVGLSLEIAHCRIQSFEPIDHADTYEKMFVNGSVNSHQSILASHQAHPDPPSQTVLDQILRPAPAQ